MSESVKPQLPNSPPMFSDDKIQKHSFVTYGKPNRILFTIIILVFVHGLLAGAGALFCRMGKHYLSLGASLEIVDAALLAFMSLIICQASLLGIWAALGRTVFLMRLGVTLVGICGLSVTLCFGIGEMESEWFVLVASVTFFVMTVLGIPQWFRVRAMHIDDSRKTTVSEIQFSIRHLLIVTLLVACLLGIGRYLGPTIPSLDVFAFGAALATCFATTATLAVWAMLGISQLPLRVSVAFAATILTAGTAYFAMEASHIDPGTIWFAIVILYGAMLLASLWVVRLAGYRLLRPQ